MKLILSWTALVLISHLGLAPLSRADGLISDFTQASSVLSSGILQGLAAKELCTCIHVIRVDDAKKPPATPSERLETCIDRSELPIPEIALKALVTIDVDTNLNEVRVTPTPLGDVLSGFGANRAIGKFEGEALGCRLLTREETKAEFNAPNP